ncbi:MAG TPA: CYTH domain-containing protein [Polyangiaceae bacterium]
MTIGVERERKFLVASTAFLEGHLSERVAQCYLVSTDDVELRVRVAGDTATLTIKSGETTLVRDEIEYVLESRSLASALLMSSNLRIAKDRFDVVAGSHVWNVDIFLDENAGLVIAEVEFDKGDVIELPEWVGEEVTGDPRYYNRNLAATPFTTWPRP